MRKRKELSFSFMMFLGLLEVIRIRAIIEETGNIGGMGFPSKAKEILPSFGLVNKTSYFSPHYGRISGRSKVGGCLS